MKKVSFFIKSCIFLTVIGILAIIGLYTYAFFSPKIELKSTNQYYIYDNNKELVYEGSKTSEWVSLNNISEYSKDAVISIEDKNFYKHKGFDYLRIVKALISNLKNKNIVQGASTISQQYIKNMYLSFDKTWKRKIEEAFLTLELEMHYDKDEILEGYVNTINYGQGNFGIENASQYYFNKKAKDLSLEEAIMLAGIPKNPNNYNPVSNIDKCIKRANVVAKTMLDNNYITEKQYKDLNFSNVNIVGKKSNNNLQMLMYYQDAVIDELKTLKNIPSSLIESGGLKIYTTLNLEAQKSLEESILNNMSDSSNLQVASIVINPNNGGVEALTGGLDYSKSQFNRAISSKRQVGSTMKPILYYSALENNFTSATTFLSAPTTFNLANNQSYAPSNFNDKYANKDITMAAAISYSDNIYAVKTHLFLGEDNLVKTAKKMGITTKLTANASLPLGTSEISMYDFANAYTTLASGGYKRKLHFIKKVEDLDGNTLYEFKDKKDLVLNENYVFILNELLTSTYNSAFIDYNNPTVMSLSSKLNQKYAIKTGSTGTDCWIVGYNKRNLMLVWNGYDDNREVEVKDGSYSKNIWLETMNKINTKNDWYTAPKNIIGMPLNAITGKYDNSSKNSNIFYFVKGTEPGGKDEIIVSKNSN
ncbi:MAG TPA: penicillin-binding protein [Bacilli bacterium]|nr:penicillin-binding protein [Bacilli bacterium]